MWSQELHMLGDRDGRRRGLQMRVVEANADYFMDGSRLW